MVPVSQTNKEIAKISKQIYIYIYIVRKLLIYLAQQSRADVLKTKPINKTVLCLSK